MLLPLQRMTDRYNNDRDESDVVAFFTLLYLGEMITKLVVAGLLAGVRDDRDRSRYAIARGVVRADGIGDWATALDQLVTGPASQLINDGLQRTQRELTQRIQADDWRRESLEAMRAVLKSLEIISPRDGEATPLRQWFQWFAALRNKTRGHGATLSGECIDVLPALERSVMLLRDHLPLFDMEWAHLHRNLSGKYRVSSLSDRAEAFQYLKSATNVTLANGVYIHSPMSSTLLQVDLLLTDADLSDFLLPNGAFRDDSFEALSYITNERRRTDGSDFLTPTDPLPASLTQGKPELDVQGSLLGNLPEPATDYVPRPVLQARLEEALLWERHEVVSLAGPGGIGKTSLALHVLRKLGAMEPPRFQSAVWFSARDIDLSLTGPKPVRPHGISLEDFAREYVQLMEPQDRGNKGFKAKEYLAKSLESGPLGPTIFIFDNFETVLAPAEIFRWLDTYIRPPNKILITTRARDFAGDYPIEVGGMSEHEATELISATASRLGVLELLSPEYVQELMNESAGHPYVLKILLGEVAKQGRATKPERIIAGQDQILQALFERTYSALTPAAQRIFLLIANWRSVVPTLAVEAVALRSAEERLDVRGAVSELRRLSLVEELAVSEDAESFLSMPLAAASFGRRKLNASPLRAAIELDTELLRAFGAARREDVRAGLRPRIQRFLSAVAIKVAVDPKELDAHSDIFRFIGDRVPSSLLDIATLYREHGTEEALAEAKRVLRQYIESGDHTHPPGEVWGEIAQLCSLTRDVSGEIHALVEMADCLPDDADALSRAALTVNRLLAEGKRERRRAVPTEERRVLLMRLARRMEAHVDSWDATDLSRLAWLYLNLGNESRAAVLASRGLILEPGNEHCQGLVARGIGSGAEG